MPDSHRSADERDRRAPRPQRTAEPVPGSRAAQPVVRMLAVQRAVGNAAAARLIQRKIGFEFEADAWHSWRRTKPVVGEGRAIVARMPAREIVLAAGAIESVKKPLKAPLRNPKTKGDPPTAFSRGQRAQEVDMLAAVQHSGPSGDIDLTPPSQASGLPSFKISCPGDPSPSRSAALAVASATVERFGRALLEEFNARKRGTRVTEVLFDDRADIPEKMQPFILRVDAAYAGRVLRLYYQFDTTYRGYIVGITDRSDADARKVVMTTAFPDAVQDAQYSSQHETHNTPLAQLVDTDTANWDAMTKIAGEAPRWRCVLDAARAGTLSDDLVFHHNGLGISFADLWLTWNEFDKAYGISDASVANKLNEWNALNPNLEPSQSKKQLAKEKAKAALKSKVRQGVHAGHALQP